ncbi:MAG: cyclase family protein, partial [Phycisphaerales bacterium]|nr:cyclase family protein [Phycisphaerales bacterium]
RESAGHSVIIDLSHELHAATPVFPGSPAPAFEPVTTIERDGYAERYLQMGSHTGTHIDAPCHVLAGGRSLDQYPIEAFSGRAVVIDVAGCDRIDAPHLRPLDGLAPIPDFVLLRTGWDSKWGTPGYFEDFPTLTAPAAERLASLSITGIGLDVASVDRVGDHDLPIHRVLMESELLIVENLTRLGRIPPGPFEFHCAPLRVLCADGSPVRAYARVRSSDA